MSLVRSASRISLITAATLIWVFLTIFILHHIGARRSFEPFVHPRMEASKQLVIARNGESPGQIPGSPAAYEALKGISPLVWHITLRSTVDDVWVVYPKGDLQLLTDRKGPVESLEWRELTTAQYVAPEGVDSPGSLLRLEQFAERFPDVPLLIEVISRDVRKVEPLMKKLQSLGLKLRAIVHSPMRRVLHVARKAFPRWVYGSSPASLVQAEVMTSLFLETISPLDGDYFFSEIDTKPDSGISLRLAAEITRRKKFLLLETDSPETFANHRLRSHSQGVLTRQPRQFLEFFKRLESN